MPACQWNLLPSFQSTDFGHNSFFQKCCYLCAQITRSHFLGDPLSFCYCGSLRTAKCDGTRAETRFRLSAKRTNPFQSVGASVQSTTGRRGVRISCSNAGYTMFRGNVKSTDYLLHSPVSTSLPLPCVTLCHHVSTGL